MDDPRWLDEANSEAWRSFVTMQEGLSEYIERQLRAHSGMSSADYEVLAHLSEVPEGRIRSNALARLLRWEKGRLSQHLTRMQSRGLIRREPCPTDQRGAVVVITERRLRADRGSRPAPRGRHTKRADRPRYPCGA